MVEVCPPVLTNFRSGAQEELLEVKENVLHWKSHRPGVEEVELSQTMLPDEVIVDADGGGNFGFYYWCLLLSLIQNSY